MNSSGIKRGLAVSAISALAITGFPSVASATPIADTLTANAVELYTQTNNGLSPKNDGTNTTVSLVAGGGANVTSVLFQYAVATAPTTWINVPGGLVARNADGVFAVDWAAADIPAGVVAVRAVPNTGEANADEQAATLIAAAAARTVELGTEGDLGVFQEPYTEAAGSQDLVAVRGTVSEPTTVNVSDVSHEASSGAAAAAVVTDDSDPATTERFAAVLDIDGYTYSPGTEANQIALNAATPNTDDAEGSTLYLQQIGSITATPETQELVNTSDSRIVLTVLDTRGNPVAGAQVGVFDNQGTAATTDDTSTILGYTDGNGQFVDTTQTTAETFTYYANTTDTDAYEPGTDPADTATVTTYTPALNSVDIVNERNRSNFDVDELSDADDFSIVTKDQRGAAFEENLTGGDVEYRYTIDPSGAGATFTSAWIPLETVNGKVAIPGLTDTSYNGGPVPEGTVTYEARRPNVNGTGLTTATPETVSMSESEITYEEGAQATAPVNGDYTVVGRLANDTGALAGRAVDVTYTPQVGGNSALAPQADQPSGVTVTGPNTATVITDANGEFRVKLRDPGVPVNTTPSPESGTVNAIAREAAGDATSLQGDLGPDDSTVANDPDNAEQDLVVNFRQAPAVSNVTIDVDALFAQAAPGQPVDLDIQALDANGNPIADVPVEITVNKGFLSPNAEDDSDLVLADGQNDTGDLYGFFRNLGTTRTVSTGDSGTAGLVAAIERDAGFDDDGLTTMTITVKAGSVTKTVDVTFDATDYLNLSELSLERADGEPAGDVPISEDVEFQLYATDQFGNLVGDVFARVTDDSPVADVETDGDFGGTLTDFVNDGPGIRAFSDAATVQNLIARIQGVKTLVDANDDAATTAETYTDTASITWVEQTGPGEPVAVVANLEGTNNGGRADRLRVTTGPPADGARVKLFRVTAPGERVRVAAKNLSDAGIAFFKVPDLNGRKFTKYYAVVKPTADTRRAVSNRKRVR